MVLWSPLSWPSLPSPLTLSFLAGPNEKNQEHFAGKRCSERRSWELAHFSGGTSWAGNRKLFLSGICFTLRNHFFWWVPSLPHPKAPKALAATSVLAAPPPPPSPRGWILTVIPHEHGQGWAKTAWAAKTHGRHQKPAAGRFVFPQRAGSAP